MAGAGSSPVAAPEKGDEGASGGSGSERLLPAERLRRRADFLRCYREGRRRQGAPAILYFLPNGLGLPRLGITASRKVGDAVVRHRLKRRIREIYRRWDGRRALPALDMVMHLKPEAKQLDFAAFRQELLRLLAGVSAARARGVAASPMTPGAEKSAKA